MSPGSIIRAWGRKGEEGKLAMLCEKARLDVLEIDTRVLNPTLRVSLQTSGPRFMYGI